jgi:fatty-acyl-CoA synthase
VSEAYVFGVPSEPYGEEVAGWVKLSSGAALTANDLDATCRGRIASVQIPRYWKCVDAFPMTVSDKVQKFRMREMATAELRHGASAALPTALTRGEARQRVGG